MTTPVCFTMDNLGDAADLGRGVIQQPRAPGQRPALEDGFPAMLALYARHDIRVTHFVEGWNGEAHPREVRQLVDAGHGLGMHGWQHEQWAELEPQRARELAQRATEALERASGQRPRAFRAPGGASTPESARILRGLGYRIDASLPPGGAEGGPVRELPEGLWSVPYRWAWVDATHWLWHGRSCAEVEELWRAELERAAGADCPVIFIWHPHVMGIDARRLAVGEAILARVRQDQRLRPCTLEQLVEARRPSLTGALK